VVIWISSRAKIGFGSVNFEAICVSVSSNSFLRVSWVNFLLFGAFFSFSHKDLTFFVCLTDSD
jgi:hypothetical protein